MISLKLDTFRKLISDFFKFRRFLSIKDTIVAVIFNTFSTKKNFQTAQNEKIFVIEASTSDIYTLAGNFSKRNSVKFNFGLFAIPPQVILPSKLLFVDVGANIGASSVRFANQFPLASIFAIEPEHRNFERLTFNTLEYDNITVLKYAVCDNNRRVGIK